jgi:hypothetical protein
MKKPLKNRLLTWGHDFVVKHIYPLLTDKNVAFLEYFFYTKKILNIKNPKTFAEKIQWVKLHECLERFTKYVDKYEVRDFIRKTIGKKYLVPLYGVWDNFDEIDFNKLPGQFVLKTTHGSHYVYVCKDKQSLDKDAVKKNVTKWMHENFYKKMREIQYRDCKPKIICEKYLTNEPSGLVDYRIFCFNGIPYFIGVGTELVRAEDFMDLHWNVLPILSIPYPNSKIPLNKPGNFSEMIEVAKRLSKPFPFVRVDLYSIENKIYFGELTFTPANGVQQFEPPNINYELGKLIDLSKYNSN